MDVLRAGHSQARRLALDRDFSLPLSVRIEHQDGRFPRDVNPTVGSCSQRAYGAQSRRDGTALLELDQRWIGPLVRIRVELESLRQAPAVLAPRVHTQHRHCGDGERREHQDADDHRPNHRTAWLALAATTLTGLLVDLVGHWSVVISH